MLTNSKATVYAVARDGKIITDALARDDAERHRDHVNQTMSRLGLDPDAVLVTVEITTRIGKPRPVVEAVPVDEPPVTPFEDDAPVDEPPLHPFPDGLTDDGKRLVDGGE